MKSERGDAISSSITGVVALNGCTPSSLPSPTVAEGFLAPPQYLMRQQRPFIILVDILCVAVDGSVEGCVERLACNRGIDATAAMVLCVRRCMSAAAAAGATRWLPFVPSHPLVIHHIIPTRAVATLTQQLLLRSGGTPRHWPPMRGGYRQENRHELPVEEGRASLQAVSGHRPVRPATAAVAAAYASATMRSCEGDSEGGP